MIIGINGQRNGFLSRSGFTAVHAGLQRDTGGLAGGRLYSCLAGVAVGNLQSGVVLFRDTEAAVAAGLGDQAGSCAGAGFGAGNAKSMVLKITSRQLPRIARFRIDMNRIPTALRVVFLFVYVFVRSFNVTSNERIRSCCTNGNTANSQSTCGNHRKQQRQQCRNENLSFHSSASSLVLLKNEIVTNSIILPFFSYVNRKNSHY